MITRWNTVEDQLEPERANGAVVVVVVGRHLRGQRVPSSVRMRRRATQARSLECGAD